MKNTLQRSALVVTLFVAGVAFSEENGVAHLRDTIRQQWMRVQTEFVVLKSLDGGDAKTALQRFQTVRITNAITDREIVEELTVGNTNHVRRLLNGSINGWIIQEAGHSQYPALTVLLDNPEKLHFLKELAEYRASHANLPSDESDKLVADILKKATDRKSVAEENKKQPNQAPQGTARKLAAPER